MDSNSTIAHRKTGEIVMQALQCIDEPTTFTNIVRHISTNQEIAENKLKEPIKQVLHRAVEFGFVKKQAGKYSLGTENTDVDEQDGEGNVDKSGHGRSRRSRRRMQKSRSRSRRRSGSRKRRSSRRTR